ncbi:hypothetical protein [Pedobacter rhizosphaerae]|uniref:Colicin import membrane protein n=1 Tax=Pedobacter rhizosphaerae TaxID=390241 RepID=A0A1H9T836_9SPHI|nr:hypothetical protein [Pedobacter rhizosphaerae]SER93257.1 hypothetical protein SAMN04488023_12119 [Pedobacter rhizosphaerae]
MKKLLSLIAIAALGLTTAFAQTPAATTTPAKKVVKKEVKTATAPVKAGVKQEAKKVETKTTTTATKVKADGTPDMRFKENKAKAVTKVAGPTKKDGTADMRYKANKEATKTVKKN